MRNFLLILLLFGSSVCLYAQTNNVGIGTNSPDGSAKLEIASTDQGLLTPRLSKTQRNAITIPANGLMIYQTDSTPGFYYYNGASWQKIGDDLGSHLANRELDMDTNKIVNLAAPVNGLDAVNKAYVDALVGGGGGAGSACCPSASEVSTEGGPFINVREAFEYCDTLTAGGNTDWRIPYFKEIMDGLAGNYPIPGPYSTNTLWTREQVQGTAAHWRTYRLSDGYISATTGNSSGIYCRCVRGN